MRKLLHCYLLLLLTILHSIAEIERVLQISESAKVGKTIGWILGGGPHDNTHQQNFYIVFPNPDSQAEKFLEVNDRTGEISVRQPLDHEQEQKFVVLAVPADGQSLSIKVVVEVQDENDNSPQFPMDKIKLEISEYARINTELALPLAKDADSGQLSTQKYRIVSGNVNNIFRISVHSFNHLLYVDLVVNGQLDREYRERYDLVVEAMDGAQPPKTGRLEVEIHILDANDNAPKFLQSSYSTHIFGNVTSGFPVLKVTAKDIDAGENARISYKLLTHYLKDASQAPFSIDPISGTITVDLAANCSLQPGTVYELLVAARDYGLPHPLESTVLVSIFVDSPSQLSSNQLNIIWLTEDASSKVPENLVIGYVLARILIRGQDHTKRILSISGSEDICLKQTDSPMVYLLIVCGELDREKHLSYKVNLVVRNEQEEVVLDHPVQVDLVDVNDNRPVWNQTHFRFVWNWQHREDNYVGADNHIRLVARDADEGENGRVRYWLEGTEWFTIDPELGVLHMVQEFDCDEVSEAHFKVVAEDNGKPERLSSSVDVVVQIVDTDAKPPFFDHSLYEANVKEDLDVSSCILQVSALNSGCGNSSSQVTYSFVHDSVDYLKPFKLNEKTGKICLVSPLDYELVDRYQFGVAAHNQVGKSSITLVNIVVEDVNDNAPHFDPLLHYKILVDGQTPLHSPLLSVLARDRDSLHAFGSIRYAWDKENELSEHFDLNPVDGTVCLRRAIDTSEKDKEFEEELMVRAEDGGGLISEQAAKIRIKYLGKQHQQSCVSFSKSIYEFSLAEDVLPGISISSIEIAEDTTKFDLIIVDKEPIKQSMKQDTDDGHWNGYDKKRDLFKLDDKSWGSVIVLHELDADHQDVILLNLQAENRETGCRNFTQIKVYIQDINDNSPIFNMDKVEVDLPENFPIHEPFFAVQAIDKDKHENGRITYEYVDSEPACPLMVRPQTGQLVLAASLDYEKVRQYRLRIRAQDQGIPPKSALQEVLLKVQDINDNPPVFQQQLYSIEVPENTGLMEQLLQVQATDKDSGRNSKIHYQLVEENLLTSSFGINSYTGEVFLRQTLDRETIAEYSFLVVAVDGGKFALSANCSVHVRVTDINDNTPNCSSIPQLTVVETHNPRDIVGRIKAEDADEGANGTLTYRLQQTQELFEVKPRGEVYLRKKINISSDSANKKPSHYRLTVIVEDQGVDPKSAVCQVTIRRVSPVLSTSIGILNEPLERTIRLDAGNMAVGTEIIKIQATNVAHWQVEKSEISDFFSIQNGSVLVRKNIPDDSSLFGKTHQLAVQMLDAAGQPKHLIFTVKPPNSSSFSARSINTSNAPIVLKIETNQRIGSKLLSLGNSQQADAAGNKSTPQIYFKMVNFGNLIPNKSMLELDEMSGDIYLADSPWSSPLTELTFGVSQHSLLANINEDTDVLNKSTVIVEFGSKECSKPTFQQVFVQWNASEDAHIGYLIGQLELTAPTTNSTKLTIVGEGNANVYFKIDQGNGDVYLQRQLNFNLAPFHLLVVELSQSSNQTSGPRCVVQINVLDVNNNDPQFLSASNCSLYKQFRGRTAQPIHYFVAVDEDSPNFTSIQYEIVSGNQAQFFSLNSTTGALRIMAEPEELQKEKFPMKLCVRAWDAQPAANQSSLSVQPRNRRYTDQNFMVLADPLYWTPDSNGLNYFEEGGRRKNKFVFTMVRGTPMGAVVHNFKRLDFTEEVLFELSPKSDNAFEIDRKDGILKSKERLNAFKYSFTLLVSGIKRKQEDHTSITIKLLDNITSNGPKIVASSCSNITLRENLAVPNLARIFVLAQQDQQDISFRIEGGSGSQLFSINEKSGLISCKELNREVQAEHLLVISASDNSTPKRVDVCTVRIVVLDENDNLPVFSPSTPSVVSIAENGSVSSVLATIHATDLDEGPNARLIYKLSSDKSQMLDINSETGQLIIARDLPFADKEWKITVVAEDSGNSRVLNAEKGIKIIDNRKRQATKDINPPQFLSAHYVAVVAEGQPKGQFVAQLETSLGSRRSASLIYSLAGNQDGAFEMDQFGRLVTAQELDAEIQSLYTLTVLASKDAKTVSQTEVQVRVLNLNDNPPSFPPLRAVMMLEGLPLGSLLTTIKANDVDQDSLLEYSLVSSTSQFEIGRFTGHIHLKKALDYELQTSHLLRLQVFDGTNMAHTNLTLELIDINDNAPTFEQDFLHIDTAVSTPQNTTIAVLQAKDKDSGENGRVTYELLNANDSFGIDSRTGAVKLLTGLTKVGICYLIEIKASDHGKPALKSTTTLQLNVLPKDQLEQPTFKQQTYRFMVSENFPSYLFFGQVTLLNTSVTHCGFVVIGNNSERKWMDINPEGHMFLTAPLDREEQWEWKGRVGVLSQCSSGVEGSEHVENKMFTSTTRVVVQLADANDNAPVFQQGEINLVIGEQLKKGTVLGRLSAHDEDSEENGKVNYKLLAGDEFSILRVHPDSGIISFDHFNDTLLLPHYSIVNTSTLYFPLMFSAQDSGVPVRVTQKPATFQVDVGNWSGSAPVFPVTAFRKVISEAAPVGTKVLRALAVNRLNEESRLGWKYSLMMNETSKKSDKQALSINESTAEVFLQHPVDVESGITHLQARVSVIDTKGRTATVPLHLYISGVDEWVPVFSKSVFTFQIPLNAQAGYRIGQVTAKDQDIGWGSKVSYSMHVDGEQGNTTKIIKFLKLDAESGELYLRRALPSQWLKNKIHLAGLEQIKVSASSNPRTQQQSQAIAAQATVYLEIGKEPTLVIWNNSTSSWPSINGFSIALLILFLLLLLLLIFAILRFYYKTSKSSSSSSSYATKKAKKQVYSVSSRSNAAALMADINRLSPSPTFENGQCNLRLPPPPPPTNELDFFFKPCPFSLISSQNGTNGSTSGSEEHFQQVARCRYSQPDSGILSDPEAISLNSTKINNYLTNVVGIPPNRLIEQGNMSTKPTARVISVEKGHPMACTSSFRESTVHCHVTPAPNYESMSTIAQGEEYIHKTVEKRDSDLNELLYAKIDEIMGPGPVNCSSSGDCTKISNYILPSYHPPQIIDANSKMPPFQPMTEVFKEIRRLQKESRIKSVV